MCTCVCFAAGTVLTIRKRLHPALRSQDHAPTRNCLQSPSKKGHFQHRCECGWKRKERVRVGGFLCPQKALSDKVGQIFHTFMYSAYVFSLPLREPGYTGGGCHPHGCCSQSVSAGWDQCWNMSTDKRRKVEALWLPLSSGSFDVNLKSRSTS